MRCPKCGYISFDRVERCGKCAHDLLAVAAQLRGPMAKVSAPMFLGGLLRAGGASESGVAEVEPVTFDLDEEALDLGEMGVEAGVVTLEEEEEPVAGQEEEEIGIEMPSLSGIDVSDLMPPREEAAPVEMPEEGISGIAMPETLAAEAAAPPAVPEKDDTFSSLNFDLTGGESRGEADRDADQEPAGEVLDLTGLLGARPEEPAEDPSDPFALPLGSSDAGGGFDLTLDDAGPAASPEASTPEQHDIPDLGLSLESDEEEEAPTP